MRNSKSWFLDYVASKRRCALFFVSLVFLFFIHSWLLPAEEFAISAQVVDLFTIRIDFKIPDNLIENELILYRSTAELTGPNIDKVRYPVAEFRIDTVQKSTSFTDRNAAHNIKYHYLAFIRQKDEWNSLANSNRIEISLPDVSVEELDEPVILVNKRYYVLEIRNNGKTAKRYPISLGRDPFNRKLHQDNKTTPEGLYKIINIQNKGTFYKAIDIDYPNEQDSIRYDFMKAEEFVPDGRGIGGEIQVHGQAPSWGSIHRNWTWGCISLRNSDIDEILNLPELKIGTPVIIIGSAFSQEDQFFLEKERSFEEIKGIQKKLAEMEFYTGAIDGILGKQTRFAIGRFQKEQGLPISCFLDSRTEDFFVDKKESSTHNKSTH